MGLLTELIFNSVDTSSRGSSNYISVSSFFPCPYKMYLTYTNQDIQQNTPRQILNMNDGHDQEDQAVRRLKAAGIEVKNQQKTVVVGRSNIKGHIDGTIEIGKEEILWEHKAMADERFREFKATRLLTFPGYMAQVQTYMGGLGLKKCFFQVKNKNNNDIEDAEIPFNVNYFNEVVAWVDSIKLQNWVPEPLKSANCVYCGINCFGRIIDFSKINTLSEEEVAKKWRDGKMYQLIGETLEQEARAYLIGVFDKTGERVEKGKIGDSSTLIVDELKVTKQISNRTEINKSAILRLYGQEGFSQVINTKEVVSYVIRDLRR